MRSGGFGKEPMASRMSVEGKWDWGFFDLLCETGHCANIEHVSLFIASPTPPKHSSGGETGKSRSVSIRPAAAG